ncbi:UDP-2,4-diacetamido-2,4,6-trideoxy-beta-L-altropyranose hydrolase [Bradyrhizobium canariense]|uniref:UDP-2,4-diacetamido-2,4, 6-trideoxy-beta-L-altropyranose hydrolase n=1 Tax=Bradyrhizobium canariense TaxID=255045 RepID=UPI001B8A2CA4|nr:UDP-2,4-diacetamido-2,4,6-trideoxy-beta-L-altropyranose hydrolase [Bradyrhizobium canariense]MBR0953432.1 UDP-2,4-diacetamido-2,4,6-trideoxy-beta-L-altropyranose hydrolase [Bradyrhizobium canariense]
MERRVVIRVDASVEMGIGHLTRCITLANNLAGNGARAVFVMRAKSAAFSGLVEAAGHQLVLLTDPESGNLRRGPADSSYANWLPVSWQQDSEQTREAIDSVGEADWLVVDHYALDARWERALRRPGLCILAIDDLANRPHDCAFLLDQNLVLGMETRYQPLVPETCRYLLGPGYALLRPEFPQLRRSLAARSGAVNRILICFGGTDPSNETGKALGAVRRLSFATLAVDVVIGRGNPNADLVEQQCREMNGAALHPGAENMAELMARADLAIGAGGVMSWERCCLGLPTVAIGIAENQVGVLTALAATGALVHLGAAASVTEEGIAQALHSLLCNAGQVRSMSETALALVDGDGVERVRRAVFC